MVTYTAYWYANISVSVKMTTRDSSQNQQTLVEQVINKLEQLVLTKLTPGDRLPTERDLAQQYGVSRTVVREAVRALTSRGLLEVRSRSGVVVSAPTVHQVAQTITSFLRAGLPQFDYRKVLEVRLLLEVQIAGLAAERRNENDLRQLEIALEENLQAHTLEDFVRWDIGFHAALAHATHNELYSLLLDSISEVMRAVRIMAFYHNMPEPSWVRVHRYHSVIFDQVKRGSIEGARQAMRDHLAEAEDTIMRVMATRALQSSQGS
jgi:GntR family transcriptional repressor for pyruvate dehydrogenase complex